jgi:Dehydrogenases with different specificities (related to short-chain alcohol dehydrogenases)
MSFQDLKNKVVIITGSTKGIGLETAKLFKSFGSKVVINSRNKDDVIRISEMLNETIKEGYAYGVAGDVSIYSDCEKIVNETENKFGKVDILINNAGVSLIAESLELSPHDYERVLRINLFGAFYMAQLAARSMVKKKVKGSIINVASIYGLLGVPKRAAYVSSKFGLIGLTKVLATEWAHYGIRVNAVAPGYIRTPMDVKDTGTGEYTTEDIEGRTPMGRYGESLEVAYLIAFLASDISSYITGAVIPIDGGWSAFGAWDRLLKQIRNK